MDKIKFLIVAIIAAISFSSCSEDEPAKMLWEVSATPTESVKAVFDPGFYHQIQITADGEWRSYPQMHQLQIPQSGWC